MKQMLPDTQQQYRGKEVFTKFTSKMIQSISCNVCGLSSPPGNPTSQWTGDFWSNNVSLISARRWFYFQSVWMILFFIFFLCFLFLSWWSSLLCIVVELAAEGSVRVAVGVGDRWQMTCHMTCCTWHSICEKCHVTCDI